MDTVEDGNHVSAHDAVTSYGSRACILFAATVAVDADRHCEPAAPKLRSQRVFDWLEQASRTLTSSWQEHSGKVASATVRVATTSRANQSIPDLALTQE